jgi:hypothetical protein
MSKKVKELDANDFKIAELIARGATEAEILSVYGKSRSSLQRLKAREDFQQLVQQAKSNLKIAIAEASVTLTKEQHIQKLEQFRQNQEKLGMETIKTGLRLLKLINQRLEIAEASDFSVNQIAPHLKSVCMAFQSGFEMAGNSLGIDRLMMFLEEFESEN